MIRFVGRKGDWVQGSLFQSQARPSEAKLLLAKLLLPKLLLPTLRGNYVPKSKIHKTVAAQFGQLAG